MINILTTRMLLPQDIDYISKNLSEQIGDQFHFDIPAQYTEEGLLPYAKDADVFLGPFVTVNLLEAAKRLKLIQVPWTGMDTFPFQEMKGFSIPLCNSHSNSIYVAEFAVGLMFSLLKKIAYHDRLMRVGNWNRQKDTQTISLSSSLLSHKTVGILGYGAIGRKIGDFLKPYDVALHVLEKQPLLPKEQMNVKVFSPNAITDFLSELDVLIVSVPLTNSTKNLLDEDAFCSMKNGVFVINVSRAEIINEAAIYNAIASKKVAGFASDVWYRSPSRGEGVSPPSLNYSFENFDQIILSPHRAAFSETGFPHLDDAIDNIIRLHKGLPFKNIVDLQNQF